MARGKKETEQKPDTLRDQVRVYRRGLKGKAAAAFDAVFFEVSGNDPNKGIKRALLHAQDLRKAFTAAKQAVQALPKEDRQSDETVDEDE